MSSGAESGMAAIGMFDGVHLGHRFLIGRLADEAHERGLRAVAVTFARHPLAVIAPEREPGLLTGPEEKCRLLREAGADEVVMLDFTAALRQLTAEQFMRQLHDSAGIERLVIGYDHRFGSDCPKTEDYPAIGRRAGVEVSVAPPRDEGSAQISSSMIRRALAAGDVGRASQVLGRAYMLDGIVTGGKQLGRTIGFPTANLQPHEARMIPAEGVYASRATLASGESFPAMVNIGHRPTVDVESAPLSIEAHLIGYAGDLYGSHLSLEFIMRLRGERKFDSVEALRSQLEADRKQVHVFLTDSEKNAITNII